MPYLLVVQVKVDVDVLGEQFAGWNGTALVVLPGLPGTGFRVTLPVGAIV
jgi:hypothetical protein